MYYSETGSDTGRMKIKEEKINKKESKWINMLKMKAENIPLWNRKWKGKRKRKKKKRDEADEHVENTWWKYILL